MSIMEIEIESKRNNPLLNRTEIYFTIKHEGEGTPNREIIRSEIAEKLNVDKDKVIVNTVQSSFGSQEISGYAKIYPSIEKSKGIERDFLLKRNKIIEDKGKKKGEKAKEPVKPESKPIKEEMKEITEESPDKEEQSVEEPKEEKSTEEPPKQEEQPIKEPQKEEKDEKKNDTTEEKPKENTQSPVEEKKE